MRTALLIHGLSGTAGNHFLGDIAEFLRGEHYEVITPQMTNADAPLLPVWMEDLRQYTQQLGPESIIGGHSLGGVVVLRLLEEVESVRLAFTVATYMNQGNIQNISGLPDLSSFYTQPFDWERIRRSAHHRLVHYSCDDPYIPSENAYFLARRDQWDAELIHMPGMGHFNPDTAGGNLAHFTNDLQQRLLRVISE